MSPWVQLSPSCLWAVAAMELLPDPTFSLRCFGSTEHKNGSQLFLIRQAFQSSNHLCGPSLHLLQPVRIFFG